MNTETTSHYTLTKKQLAILNLLYRFRFATPDQISTTLNINTNTINKRIKLMTNLNYIRRKYEPQEGIPRKSAVYCLMPDGINELKRISKKKYLSKVLRNIRNDENASEQFALHCLTMFDIFGILRSRYGDGMQYFTRTQMAAKSYFPKRLPDAHIQIAADEPKLFLLELLHQDQPFFLATRAVIRYIDYADNGDWPSEHEFPKILLVCDKPSLEKRLLKKMRRRIEELDSPKPKFYITSLDGLKSDEWLDMAGPDKKLTLSSI